jgi:hypothetical protein
MNRATIVLAAGIAAVAAAGGIYLWRAQTRYVTPVVPEVTHGAAPPVSPPPDCHLPGPPPVAPDGQTATLADMKLGQTAIQNFVLQLEAYQACRDNQADHAPPGTSAAQKDDWIKQGDDAVDEAHALADAFSAQLKVFNARGGGQ